MQDSEHLTISDSAMQMQVVSTTEASGRVSVLPSLADVQGQDYDTPHILIAERVGGMEDIPVSFP